MSRKAIATRASGVGAVSFVLRFTPSTIKQTEPKIPLSPRVSTGQSRISTASFSSLAPYHR